MVLTSINKYGVPLDFILGALRWALLPLTPHLQHFLLNLTLERNNTLSCQIREFGFI